MFTWSATCAWLHLENAVTLQAPPLAVCPLNLDLLEPKSGVHQDTSSYSYVPNSVTLTSVFFDFSYTEILNMIDDTLLYGQIVDTVLSNYFDNETS